MEYIALRKDLTESTVKCKFCNRSLRSLKAYVLLDSDSGIEVYSGSTCARNNIDPSVHLNHLPDLTKFTLSNEEHQGAGNNNNTGGRASTLEESRKKKALEYIELREHKVVNSLVPSYKVLKDYYDLSKTRDLTINEVNHILNIENNAPHDRKHETLLRCYNYLFWIDVALAKVDNKGIKYLASMKTTIMKYKKLSLSQLVGTNKWLEHIEGVPALQA